MTHPMGTAEPNSVASAASAWLVRIETGTVTADERRRFAEWLAADQAHPAAYREAEQFWRSLDGLNPDDIRELDRYLPPESDSERPGATHSWRRLTAMAACVLLVAGAGLWLALVLWPLGDYRTAVGEQRAITLPDGSMVRLNTDTALSIAMTDGTRRLTLHRGEAFFTVAPDRARPFEVTASEGTIRALGTAFNVRTDGVQTTVTVSEHSVRIRVGHEPPMDVQAGEQLRYQPNGWLGSVEQIDLNRTLAWQQHRLVFEDQPLPEVLEEVARYRSGRFVFLRDQSLNKLLVTGSFDTERLDRFLPALEESLPIRIVTFADRLILLYRSRITKS
ncbi:Iron dicitrate transport regulator FecR [Nitrospira defluvii]|uniref:Iron dicitrate transport regulator FecR n=2 Tax=Nitrospira defluvii TaxID=330214 RepID=A0ABM8RAF5_9BACT|nr:Iron dicitrate transport regulator FecR [Nitrospira defluvii]